MIMWLAKKCLLEPESQETGLREKEMKLKEISRGFIELIISLFISTFFLE